MSQKANSKRTLLIFAAVFIIPVIMAKLALDYDWFNKGSTNRGNLLTPPISMDQVLKDQEPLWRLLMVIPDNCDEACQNTLYSIQQVYVALGKESDRVSVALVKTELSDASALAELKINNPLLIESDTQTVSSLFEGQSQGSIYLVDPLNNAMLHYPFQELKQDAIMQSRDVLYDLKKMLKLSRIG